jgi:hypothetical protein
LAQKLFSHQLKPTIYITYATFSVSPIIDMAYHIWSVKCIGLKNFLWAMPGFMANMENHHRLLLVAVIIMIFIVPDYPTIRQKTLHEQC